MAETNTNSYYLTIGGRNMSARVRSVTITPSIATVESTSGSGVTDVENLPGLRSHTISIMLAYDTATFSSDGPKLLGKQTVVYGPEGNASGKPKHEQDFILTGAPVTQSSQKTLMEFSISGTSTGAPTEDMYDNDTF